MKVKHSGVGMFVNSMEQENLVKVRMLIRLRDLGIIGAKEYWKLSCEYAGFNIDGKIIYAQTFL